MEAAMRSERRAAGVVLLVGILSVCAADGVAAQSRGSGFFAAGPVGSPPEWHALLIGGGGEARVVSQVSAGAEAGCLAPYAGYVAPYTRIALAWHDRVVPFAAAGWAFSLDTRAELYQGPTIGAGLTYWARPRTGVRVEYMRMHLGRAGHTDAFNVVRAGVTLR
jgi:hypothetical protein